MVKVNPRFIDKLSFFSISFLSVVQAVPSTATVIALTLTFLHNSEDQPLPTSVFLHFSNRSFPLFLLSLLFLSHSRSSRLLSSPHPPSPSLSIYLHFPIFLSSPLFFPFPSPPFSLIPSHSLCSPSPSSFNRSPPYPLPSQAGHFPPHLNSPLTRCSHFHLPSQPLTFSPFPSPSPLFPFSYFALSVFPVPGVRLAGIQTGRADVALTAHSSSRPGLLQGSLTCSLLVLCAAFVLALVPALERSSWDPV